MTLRTIYVRVLAVSLLLAPWAGYAQVLGGGSSVADVDARGTAQTVEAALHLMSDRAPVVFVGTVLKVTRRGDEGSAGAGVVEIEFGVERAVRGCQEGGSYTLREWGGLWVANDQRYRVGQRLLMLLHAPGASGMSSPVGGMDGAMPVRDGAAASNGAGEAIVDLRWVGAKLARPATYATAGSPVQAGSPSDHSIAAQQASVSAVMTMISAWQEVANATR